MVLTIVRLIGSLYCLITKSNSSQKKELKIIRAAKQLFELWSIHMDGLRPGYLKATDEYPPTALR
jgi:hypothetical protein